MSAHFCGRGKHSPRRDVSPSSAPTPASAPREKNPCDATAGDMTHGCGGSARKNPNSVGHRPLQTSAATRGPWSGRATAHVAARHRAAPCRASIGPRRAARPSPQRFQCSQRFRTLEAVLPGPCLNRRGAAFGGTRAVPWRVR
ncbi:hypothetical protein PsYK624_076600 [Phanerochaete sordida]|uniref:Uncharacterized protein n=1 Tax=Phanerochaete sordida TaxID=48140 RepID=A0A9P3LDQ8_9APHY|nr:hypothetical protein PsYK624_076600 [Phanerochaete sordida]